MTSRRPRHGAWDHYVVDPGVYAAGLRLVLQAAREEGRKSAEAGMPRIALGIDDHFLDAWFQGYDEASAHRTRA